MTFYILAVGTNMDKWPYFFLLALDLLWGWIHRRIKQRREDVRFIQKDAQKNDQIYAISPWNRFYLNIWRQARQNKRAIFASSWYGGIHLFDTTGEPIGELCVPRKFTSFDVTEGKLIFYRKKEKWEYPISEIQWYADGTPLQLPEPQRRDICVTCKWYQICAYSAQWHRHLRFYDDGVLTALLLLLKWGVVAPANIALIMLLACDFYRVFC